MRNFYGLRNTRIASIYNGMIQRCYNKNQKAYKYYGERGVTVCNQWKDEKYGFINFYIWSVNNGYKDGLTIDRVNINDQYSPENCRWATMKEQANNTRRNHFIEYKGNVYTLSELAQKCNMNVSSLSYRLKRFKNDIDLALSLPINYVHPQNNGKTVYQYKYIIKKGKKELSFVSSYSSVKEASEKTNVLHSSIAKCCRGDKWAKSAGGFIWSYKKLD